MASRFLRAVRAVGKAKSVAKKRQDQKAPNLRDYENVPLTETIDHYFQREVLPHVPDAWIDKSKTKIGYEIPFNRNF